MKKLTDKERAVYEWQMDVPGFGEEGQMKLKEASVLISRCGGLGSVVAYELAAAGIGKLVIAHGGHVKPSDLNRQLLMTDDWLGKPRIETIVKRLKDLNPRLEIEAYGENVHKENVEELVNSADVVVDAAPLFEERFLLNQEAVRQKKPLVDCSMYELDAQITTIFPGKTPCLACLYPEKPQAWKRKFPVFGAVSGSVACLGAMEVIKLVSGIGSTLEGRLLTMDLRDMRFQEVAIQRRPGCQVCGTIK
jgi:molybdopterin/thiamine biosynthesis adenylyltransferase